MLLAAEKERTNGEDRIDDARARDRGADRWLVYRGQLDGSRPGNDVPVTGDDLRRAIDAALARRAVDPEQRPSLGCNIKWRAGNEPEWFKPKA